jgi:hypothetical protein
MTVMGAPKYVTTYVMMTQEHVEVVYIGAVRALVTVTKEFITFITSLLLYTAYIAYNRSYNNLRACHISRFYF